MAAIGSIQLVGNANSTNPEVELNNLALRDVIRSNDFTYAGSFSAGNQRTYASSSSIGSTVAVTGMTVILNSGDGVVVLVKRLTIGISVFTAGTAAPSSLQLMRAYGFSAPPANRILLLQSQGQLKTANPTPQALIFEHPASTAATGAMFSATNATYDVNPITNQLFMAGAKGTGPVALVMWDWRDTGMPIVLQANEALECQMNVGSGFGTTGTFSGMGYEWQWDEVAPTW